METKQIEVTGGIGREKTIINVMQDILEQRDIYKKSALEANKKRKYAYEKFAKGKINAFNESFIMLEDFCLENGIELPNPFPKKS